MYVLTRRGRDKGFAPLGYQLNQVPQLKSVCMHPTPHTPFSFFSRSETWCFDPRLSLVVWSTYRTGKPDGIISCRALGPREEWKLSPWQLPKSPHIGGRTYTSGLASFLGGSGHLLSRPGWETAGLEAANVLGMEFSGTGIVMLDRDTGTRVRIGEGGGVGTADACAGSTRRGTWHVPRRRQIEVEANGIFPGYNVNSSSDRSQARQSSNIYMHGDE